MRRAFYGQTCSESRARQGILVVPKTMSFEPLNPWKPLESALRDARGEAAMRPYKSTAYRVIHRRTQMYDFNARSCEERTQDYVHAYPKLCPCVPEAMSC